MVRSILFITMIFTLKAHAEFQPNSAIPVNKTFKVRHLIQIVSDCTYQQAQTMLRQATANGHTETIVSIEKPIEFQDGGEESNLNGPDGLVFITPANRTMITKWGQGCISEDASIGLGTGFGGLLLWTTDTAHRCQYGYGAELYTPQGTMPEVAYDPSDRAQLMNSVGQEQYLDETITKLKILKGIHPKEKIQLLNISGDEPTEVYFDPTRYIACLKKKMGI